MLAFRNYLDGIKKEIETHIEQLETVVKEHGAVAVLPLSDKEESAKVWQIRGALVKAVEAVSEQEPLDIVVPIHQIDTFVNFVNKLEKESEMRMISFGHAGDGNVHLCVVRGNRNEKEWKQDLHKNLDALYRKAYELGGVTSGEHGIGLSKQKYFFKETNPANVQLMNQIKQAFDSRHILNDGISYVYGKSNLQ